MTSKERRLVKKHTAASSVTNDIAGNLILPNTSNVHAFARKDTNNQNIFTAGSIPFINSNLKLAQDNSNLFWDDINKRLCFNAARTEYISSDATGELSFHFADTDVGAKFYSGVNPLLYVRRLSAGISTQTKLISPSELHVFIGATEVLHFRTGNVTHQIVDIFNKTVNLPKDSAGNINSFGNIQQGAGYNSLLYFNGTDYVINPDRNNASGKLLIGPTGNRDIVFTNGEVKGDLIPTGEGSGLLFGEIYGADTATVISISGTGIANKVQITAFAVDGESNGMTPDHTNDHITVLTAGKYLCNVSMHINSISGGTAEVYGYSVFKNNGTGEFVNLHGQRNMAGSGGDEGSVSLSGIIDLAVDDTVEVWIWNNTNTDNVEVDDINLSLVQIGGT